VVHQISTTEGIDMSLAQVKLRQVYLSRWPALVKALRKVPAARRVSMPLLLDLDAHAFFRAPLRLFVVGQQTGGWCGVWGSPLPKNPVDYLISEYASFHLGKGYRHSSSPFWAAAYELSRCINPGAPLFAFAWNNLCRVDENGNRPSLAMEQAVLRTYNVLPDEIAIGRPSVVVFLTGPYYDNSLRRVFPKIIIQPLRRLPQVALLRHPALPRHSYRTYHPRYLRQSKQWKVLSSICRLVIRDPPP
jgi:hypothetical protein